MGKISSDMMLCFGATGFNLFEALYDYVLSETARHFPKNNHYKQYKPSRNMRKKKCKSILDKRLVMAALKKCFSSSKTKKRGDTFYLFKKYCGFTSKKELIDEINNKTARYKNSLSTIADILLNEIKTDTVNFPAAKYRIRKDHSNGKIRQISILHIKQLIYDHIAVMALEPALKSIGQFQVSSIKGKGQSYARKHIHHWLFDKKLKYFVKLDIKKYFPSIDKRRLVKFISDRINNQLLLRLIARLVISCTTGGIHIGSYLSQCLANYYLSYIYHKVEGLHHERRGKKHKDVEHMVFYMDDFLLLGRNKRKLQQAAKFITEIAHDDLGLTIKQNYCVQKILDFKSKDKDKGHWIDMIGFRFCKQGISLRKTIFRRAHRQFLRVKRSISMKKNISLKQCMAFVSYMGFLRQTYAYKFFKKHNVYYYYEKAKAFVKFTLMIYELGVPLAITKEEKKALHYFKNVLKW